jgi:hypothetical protein
MNRNFIAFLAIGLLVVGAMIWGGLFASRKAHVNLEGKILKVRTVATDDKNTIVVVDFRVNNDSNIPFVAQDAFIFVTGPDGNEVEGITVSRPDMNRIFDYYKLLGPKYNEVLIIRDKVGPGEQMDRMVAAGIALPESEIEHRTGLKLRLKDVDGPTYDFVEGK